MEDYPCYFSTENVRVVEQLHEPFHQLLHRLRIVPCLTRKPHGRVYERVLVAQLQKRRQVVDVQSRCSDMDRCDVAPYAEGSTDDSETSDGQEDTGGDDVGAFRFPVWHRQARRMPALGSLTNRLPP